MELDARKLRILKAVIDEYVLSAAPVGSRSISRRSGLNLSSATIRNEMADLEELGYLEQPHTSAGRVPSDKAYRLYVDSMMRRSRLSEDEVRLIRRYFDRRIDGVEMVMQQTAQALSEVTQYTAMVLPPVLELNRLRHIQLVPLMEGRALLVVVTDTGFARDAVIRVPEGITSEHLYRISEMLTGQLADHTLSEVRQIFAQLFRDLSTHRRLLGGVMKAMEDKLIEDAPEDVVVGGPTKMLNYPEYSDVEKAKNFLTIFESKDRLAQIMKHSGGMEVTIRIGPENEIEELKDCSLVTATYRVGNHGTGTLGIIGPTRMNYQRVVTVMDYMGQVISRLLSGDIDEK